jgi:fatty acid synthase
MFFGVISFIEFQHTGMEVFLKGMSFHGVMVDEGAPEPKKIVHDMITQGISAGVVQPLPRTVFPDTEVEQAFRYSCDSGKLVGGWSTSS